MFLLKVSQTTFSPAALNDVTPTALRCLEGHQPTKDLSDSCESDASTANKWRFSLKGYSRIKAKEIITAGTDTTAP